jgi:hypothetical protein
MSTELRLDKGGFYNGHRDGYGAGVVLQPNYHLTARMVWSHDDVRLPVGNFTTNLISTRVNYSFTTNMFLTALIQYNSDERVVSSNIRFNYIYRPLSNFFLVYNERRATSGTIVDRALIAKLTRIFAF